jgi:hypothetical protein
MIVILRSVMIMGLWKRTPTFSGVRTERFRGKMTHCLELTEVVQKKRIMCVQIETICQRKQKQTKEDSNY